MRPAIGRPGRLQVRERVVGELPELLGLQVIDVQIGQPTGETGERDGASIGRPAGIQDLAQLGKRDLPGPLAPGHVVQDEHRVAATDGREHELLPVGRPAPGRLDELQALQVGIHSRLGDLTLDLAGSRISQKEIDGEEIPVGQEHHLAAIGTERRRNIVASSIARTHDLGAERMPAPGSRLSTDRRWHEARHASALPGIGGEPQNLANGWLHGPVLRPAVASRRPIA